MARKKKCSRQELFEFKSWGGARKGAGRKRKGERAHVSHRTREKLASRFPLHVTTRLRAGLPSLRRVRERRVLERAFAAGSDRFGFRLTEYSIQSNHVHLLVEAKDRNALTRGMQGLSIRVAKALNKLWGRKGKVFADRYHDRILRTPPLATPGPHRAHRVPGTLTDPCVQPVVSRLRVRSARAFSR